MRFSHKCAHVHCKLRRLPISLDGRCKYGTCSAHPYSSPLPRTMKTRSFSALIDVSLCLCSCALILLLKNHSYRVVSLGKPTVFQHEEATVSGNRMMTGDPPPPIQCWFRAGRARPPRGQANEPSNGTTLNWGEGVQVGRGITQNCATTFFANNFL